MQTKDLLQRLVGQKPCLACDIAYSEMHKRGMSDFAFAIRQLAEALWSTTYISDQQRHLVNEGLASLIQNACGEGENCRFTVQDVIENLDQAIGTDSPLFERWGDVKSLLQERASA